MHNMNNLTHKSSLPSFSLPFTYTHTDTVHYYIIHTCTCIIVYIIKKNNNLSRDAIFLIETQL